MHCEFPWMCRSSAGTYKHPARPGASEPAVQRYGRWPFPVLMERYVDEAARDAYTNPPARALKAPLVRTRPVHELHGCQTRRCCASRGWKAVSRETGDADDDVDSPDSVDPLPPDALLAATEPTAPIPPSTRRARRRRGPGEVVGRPRPPPGARCSAQGPHRKIRPIAFPEPSTPPSHVRDGVRIRCGAATLPTGGVSTPPAEASWSERPRPLPFLSLQGSCCGADL